MVFACAKLLNEVTVIWISYDALVDAFLPLLKAMLQYGYKWAVVPGAMGLFFGLGHFLAYLFFSQDLFRRFERSLYRYLEDLL